LATHSQCYEKIAGEYEAFARDEDNRAELDEDLYK
jgi:hypothetical protein